MPALAKVARQLSGEISFVGVATQDFKQDARTLVSLSGTTYPTLYDGPGHMWGTWGITGLPETFVIDTEGRVVDHVAGRLDDEELTRIVASARSSAR